MKYIISVCSREKIWYYTGSDFIFNENKYMYKTSDINKAKRYKTKVVAYKVLNRLHKQVANINDTAKVEIVRR